MESDDVEMAENGPAVKKRQANVKVGFTGPKPHVLIVEDNLINQTVLARQLKHVGLTCEGKSLIPWSFERGLPPMRRSRGVQD
jgi:hypothetical protein